MRRSKSGVAPQQRLTALRSIPSIEELMSRPAVASAAQAHGRAAVVSAARTAAAALRKRLLEGGVPGIDPVEWLDTEICRRVRDASEPSLVRVINATGVLLHTNLGRAPLSRTLVERAVGRASGYSNLEMTLEMGTRGSRLIHLQRLFAQFFPGAGSLVVNNNAAAVLLILNTLAAGKEVVVSRGELVEIGGSFRIPDICARSGATLVEVGTTNRTRIADYRRAISRETGLLLRVHPSNFRVIGFTEEVDPGELAVLGRSARLPVVADLGSGTVAELPTDLSRDPSPSSYLRLGYSLVCFSGDKMLGACQGGVILGRPRLIEKLRRNPLYRALRPGKITIAILEETLLSIRAGSDDVLLLTMLATPPSQIENRARAVAGELGNLAEVEVLQGESLVGGGSATDLRLPTWLVSIRARGVSEGALAAALRRCHPPVVARTEKGRLILDLRTVLPDDEATLLEALRQSLSPK